MGILDDQHVLGATRYASLRSVEELLRSRGALGELLGQIRHPLLGNRKDRALGELLAPFLYLLEIHHCSLSRWLKIV
jgi:hypothetical protein